MLNTSPNRSLSSCGSLKFSLSNVDGNELWTAETELNRFFNDIYIDEEDTVFVLNQALTTTYPFRLNYSVNPIPIASLVKIDASGTADEEELFYGPELASFFPTVLAPLPNGTLLLAGELSHELSYFGGYYFFASEHLVLGVDDVSGEIRTNNWLGQNYPNPTNGETTIPFYLKYGGDVHITLYDIQGRLVLDLAEGIFSSGYNTISINTSQLDPAIYFYQIQSGLFKKARKLVIK